MDELDELPYRGACPVCEQELWAGLNPAPDAVLAEHDCPGPPMKSAAVEEAETVDAESEAVFAEVVEQAQGGSAPGELAPPLG